MTTDLSAEAHMQLESLIQKKPDEHVAYILRRDPITFVPRVLLLLALIVLPAILVGLIGGNLPNLFVDETVRAITVVVGSMYFLCILLFFYTSFVIFYLDISIVTNDRIIDMEQLGLFNRRVSEFDLIRIQDVTADVRGIFASLFNYGNVVIKTASTSGNLIFFNVHDPNKIREDVIRLSQLDKQVPHAGV